MSHSESPDEPRLLSVAKHEAAHVVVGVATGLKLREAVIGVGPWPGGLIRLGYVWFGKPGPRRREAFALMTAAGIAWDRKAGPMPANELAQLATEAGVEVDGSASLSSGGDVALLREYTSGKHGAEACIRAAGAMLADLRVAHARVTRALLTRDLKGTDIATLARGETLEED
jgi:hypothetical protein